MSTADQLYTITDVAERLRVPFYTVGYLVTSRGIQPTRRIGNARVYDAAALARIESELKRMGATRCAHHQTVAV